MRLYFYVVLTSVMLFNSTALAQSPPFSTITITGETKNIFNKVCLFEKGSSKTPFKLNFDSKTSILAISEKQNAVKMGINEKRDVRFVKNVVSRVI
ncbi:MAG TPA: hypothetical protein ENI35_03665 [Candidatus Desulfofervidus auxilii]|uniref:Uncharacterized protein n=1 Tax=Desulfofervidus auxilii TaxID=1621989 RepID=A0A7C2A3Y2_DESA2|nr:hypothetical protein [Candidatus Desulfofervidus auxilii]